jgi:hypothetical protein
MYGNVGNLGGMCLKEDPAEGLEEILKFYGMEWVMRKGWRLSEV